MYAVAQRKNDWCSWLAFFSSSHFQSAQSLAFLHLLLYSVIGRVAQDPLYFTASTHYEHLTAVKNGQRFIINTLIHRNSWFVQSYPSTHACTVLRHRLQTDILCKQHFLHYFQVAELSLFSTFIIYKWDKTQTIQNKKWCSFCICICNKKLRLWTHFTVWKYLMKHLNTPFLWIY